MSIFKNYKAEVKKKNEQKTPKQTITALQLVTHSRRASLS